MAEKEVKDPKDEGVVEAPAASAAPEAPAAPETPEKDGAGESSAEEKGKKKKGTKKTRKSAEETPRDADVVETTEKHEKTTRFKTTGKGKEKKKKSTKKTKKPIVWWPWIIAGGMFTSMVTSAIILCLCGRCRDRNSGRRDCERPVKDTTEIVQKPCDTCAKNVYNIEGDALFINGSQDVAASMGDITGDNNNVANRGCVNTRPKKSTPVTKKEVIVYDTVKVERPRDDVKPSKPIKLTLEATQYEIMVCRSY